MSLFLISESQAKTIRRAQAILEKALHRSDSPIFSNPHDVELYLRCKLGTEPRETVLALWLDNSHRLISAETISTGTVDTAQIYPREVARRALEINASALIIAHNHPSGNRKPSNADIGITRRLEAALDLLEIRLIDHFIVCSNEIESIKFPSMTPLNESKASQRKRGAL